MPLKQWRRAHNFFWVVRRPTSCIGGTRPLPKKGTERAQAASALRKSCGRMLETIWTMINRTLDFFALWYDIDWYCMILYVACRLVVSHIPRYSLCCGCLTSAWNDYGSLDEHFCDGSATKRLLCFKMLQVSGDFARLLLPKGPKPTLLDSRLA